MGRCSKCRGWRIFLNAYGGTGSKNHGRHRMYMICGSLPKQTAALFQIGHEVLFAFVAEHHVHLFNLPQLFGRTFGITPYGDNHRIGFRRPPSATGAAPCGRQCESRCKYSRCRVCLSSDQRFNPAFTNSRDKFSVSAWFSLQPSVSKTTRLRLVLISRIIWLFVQSVKHHLSIKLKVQSRLLRDCQTGKRLSL